MGTAHYKIITEKGLLLQRYSGEIDKQEMAAFFIDLYNDPDYLRVTTIFSDFSNAIVALTEDELIEIAEFIIAYSPKVNHIKNSIIVKEPLITAYSQLYKEVMSAMPSYECQAFSTFKAAAHFINYTPVELESLIKQYLE